MFDFDNYNNTTQLKPYIIAEIGANHNGDIDLAKKMIEKAKECGADCVKFQSWTKDTIFSKKTYDDNYFLADDYRNRTDYTLKEIVDEYHLSPDDHFKLKEYCDEINIDFASTPFSKGEVDLLVDELNVPFIKVASMDLNNLPFLAYIAKKGKTVVLSTGLSNISDIDEAYRCLKSNGCKQIILLHCISMYPPKDECVNLNNIDMLRDLFNCPVGYSDHTLGVVAPIMSMSKRVCIIEKHFTLDKNMSGWDHKISADPYELQIICDAAECGYKMMGEYSRTVYESQERKEAFQRSIVASKHIRIGQIISENDLDFKRPGTGIPPKYVNFIIGKIAKRNIEFDEIIQLNDF